MKRTYLLPIAVFLLFHTAPAQKSEQMGAFTSFTKIPGGFLVTAENGKISLLVYSPEIIRVRATHREFGRDFSYAVVQPHQGDFTEVREEKDRLILATKDLTVQVMKNPLRVKFFTGGGKLLSEDYPSLGISWQGTDVTCYRRLFPGERFIGLGEKTGPLDRRGHAYVNWNSDNPAYKVEDDPLYTTMPFFMGLHDGAVYGIFLDNTSRTAFDFGASSDNRFSSFGAADGDLNYYFIGGSGVGRILENYTFLTGRMELPPLWSLGYEQCRWSYYPEEEVLTLGRTFRQKKIPADVIYLDIHYMDGYKIFTWNKDRFPDPKRMIDSLKRMGFHIVTIVDPGIKIEDGYFAYEQGVKNDYFIKYPDGSPYVGNVWPGRCNFPDFTRSEVRQWWGKSFASLVQPGVEGFWNDMNEPSTWGQRIPDVVQMGFDGEAKTIREGHNVYGLEMARGTYEGTKALLEGRRPFVLTRAAYAGIQRYSAVWTGDNFSSDEHMLLAVRLVNSMGLTGLAFTGPDIGGFEGEATPELFARWISVGAYTPFFRTHKEYGARRQEPWSFGENIEGIARTWIETRYRLLPYIYSSFYETAQSGIPVARSLAIGYSFDENVYRWEFQNEYLFGPNILVAPVSSTEHTCRVYLPEGGWYRATTGEFFSGNRSYLVESPLEDLPVFVRSGGIVPEQGLVQNTSEAPADTLELHVYSGTVGSSFTYYEDDGVSFQYKQGVYYKRTFSFSPGEKKFVLGSAEGSFGTRYKTVKLLFHNFEKMEKVTVNGKSVALNTGKGAPPASSILFENAAGEMTVMW